MSSEFLVWRLGRMTDGICKLRPPSGIEDVFEIDDGVSRLTNWPSDASAKMSDRFPKDIALADSLSGASFIVISGKVKAFLLEAGAKDVEYLPIKIINHKDRVASDDYFILNPLEVIDCIDQAASGARADSLDAGMIDGCKQLVIRETEVPADRIVFRTKFWSGRILIRRRVADAMIAAGLTGLQFIEPAKYTGRS
jgi:hypothetical protein